MNRKRLAQLLQSHHADAFRWASQCCHHHRQDAEEVLQTVYLKIVDGKASFNERSSFKTWLFAVIRNTATDFHHRKPRYETLNALPPTPSEVPVTDGNDYRALLARLPDRQQQVLLLVFYHDMTLQQVADITGLHIGTIRTHYARGKDALRSLIQKENV